MIYFKDDIVEVINLDSYDGTFQVRVGQKYYIYCKSWGEYVQLKSVESKWANVHVLNVALYSRPLKNYFKAIYHILKNLK